MRRLSIMSHWEYYSGRALQTREDEWLPVPDEELASIQGQGKMLSTVIGPRKRSARSNFCRVGVLALLSVGFALAGSSSATSEKGATSLSQALSAIYALGNGDDPNSSILGSSKSYPYPIFSIVPPTGEFPTHAALYDHIRDNPAGESMRVLAHVLSYETNTGAQYPASDLRGDRVNLHLGTRGFPGAGSIWSLEMVTQLFAGYTGPGAAGIEVDLVNNAQHRGDGFGQVAGTVLNSTGVGVTSQSQYRNAQAYFVDGRTADGGAAWNRGFVINANAINPSTGCAFCDYGGAYASLQSYGSHYIGLDFSNASMQRGVLATKRGRSNGIVFSNQNKIDSVIFGNSSGNIEVSSDLAIDGMVEAKVYQATLSTPASSSAPCTPGQFSDDPDFHYVCVARNKWRRVSLSDF